MAKRYYTFAELKNISGYHKPSGTLGNHYLTVMDHGEIIFVEGYNPSKKEIELLSHKEAVEARGGEFIISEAEMPQPIAKVVLFLGYSLGYDCGHIWSVRPPEMINDPIRRVLRELHLPKEFVKWVDPTEFKNYKNGDMSTDMPMEDFPFGNSSCTPFYWKYRIYKDNEDFILMSYQKKTGPIDQYWRLDSLVVKNGASREEAARFLKENWEDGYKTH